ncbi:unnamed protein product [Ilex paraguariensis]|uniref:Secreted protein n=1 Tax=Ilex paraguariensis TaxID=185542 RepID=A0ABC8U035_9AQUA
MFRRWVLSSCCVMLSLSLSLSLSRLHTKNGRLGFRLRSTERVRKGQRSACQEVPQTRSQRIHEGSVPHSDRIRGDGIRRVLRQADLHPYQQHHRRIFLKVAEYEKWARKGGVSSR